MTPNSINQSLLAPRPSPILAFMGISLLGHAVFGGVLLLASWLFGKPAIDLNQTPIKATLVRLGKQRDEKLLPRKEEEAPPPPEEVKSVEAPKPAAPDNAIKLPSKDAKDEPKPKDKKDGAKDAKKSLFDAFNKTARAGKPEELEGREDGDKNGDSAKQEGERYYGLLQSVIHRNYDVSDSIPESERKALQATVAIRLGSAGELLEVRIAKSSGNDTFDAAVLGAVKKAAPFGAPPETLRENLKTQGVAFAFKP